MDKPVEQAQVIRKTRKPRKDKGTSRPRKRKRRDPNIIPIWTFAQNELVPRLVELPASLREAFIERYKKTWIPDWQELQFWIYLQKELQKYKV